MLACIHREMVNETDLKKTLRQLAEQGLARQLVPVKHLDHGRLAFSGKSWLNLSGNDYLGLASNKALIEEFYRQLNPDNILENFGPGAAASRLMTGNSDLYEQLESRLASLYGRDSCLVFNSGYHGNAGILPAIADKGDLILADKLCHASLIDGMRLSRAETRRFPHLDYDRLEQILANQRDRFREVFLVSESIFSMDGDAADLNRLVGLKKKYRCTLYLDEAHAVGVFGSKGLGLAEQNGLVNDIDLLFGTFGKALGGVGGYVVCASLIRDYLINKSRTLIFTTGLPPVCLHWVLFVLERLPLMEQERHHLLTMADRLRRYLAEKGLPVKGSSQIVPVVIGDSTRTVAVAGQLRDHGYWVTAIRPPTVPPGSARIRLSCSAAMDEKDLRSLPGILASVAQ